MCARSQNDLQQHDVELALRADGTILGYSVQSTPAFVLFLAVAAGSILYVVGELFHVSRRFQTPALVAWGVWLGFGVGFGTDLVLTWGGA